MGATIVVHRLPACTPVSDKVLIVTDDTGNVVTQVSASSIPFVKATVFGIKAVADATGVPTNNGATLNFGVKDGTKCRFMASIAAGASLEIQAPPGSRYDLADFWFRNGAAGDGVVVQYV